MQSGPFLDNSLGASPPDARPDAPTDAALSCVVSKGAWAWALGDQAIVSIGNYLTAILVARNMLDMGRIGAFTMVLEVLLFLNSLHQALIIYPLLVRGSVLDRSSLRRLAGGCLILTAILGVPLAAVMFGAAGYFAGTTLLFWAPLALILQQLQETLRRAMLAQLRFAAAIPGDAISYLAQVVILVSLGHRLTLPMIFAAMAITSALGAGVQALQVGPRRFPLSELKALNRDFWSLSRWISCASFGSIISNFSYQYVLFQTWGAAQVGYFGVIANLAKPVNPLTTAMGSLIIPSVSRARGTAGARSAMHVGMKYALLGLAGLGIYFGILALFPSGCLRLVYGKAHPDYAQKLPNYLRILLADWTFLFVTSMTLAILNGLGYSRANFFVTLTKASATLLIALPLIVKLGLNGAMIGGALSTALAAIVAICSFLRHHRETPHLPSEAVPGSVARSIQSADTRPS